MTDRQTKILEIVNQKKKVEVVTLSKMLEVSQVTIQKRFRCIGRAEFSNKRAWICNNEEYVRYQ